MPLVKRSEPDMLRFVGLADILINPVDCSGESRGGLTKVFAERWPDMHDGYQSRCKSGKMAIGDIYSHHDKKSGSTIINIATKQNWMDGNASDNLESVCINVVDYLKSYPFHTVAMPILGIGYSRQSSVAIDPILTQYLDPLPNIIHLSIRPDRFEEPPLYLAVVGSRAYDDYFRIDLGVMDALAQFGLTHKDFEALVSGGANGVDKVACGTGKPGDNEINLASQYGLRAVVCLANWGRYGNSAGFLRNRTVTDIATHIVAFVGAKSVGTRGVIELVNRHNTHVDKLTAERVAVPVDDIFGKPQEPIPKKKLLCTHDISSTTT